MSQDRFNIASIKEVDLKKIKELESKLGVSLVAFSKDNTEVDVANLSVEEVDYILALEEKLGVTLIAYKNKKSA